MASDGALATPRTFAFVRRYTRLNAVSIDPQPQERELITPLEWGRVARFFGGRAVFASRLLVTAFVAAGSINASARDYGQYSNVPGQMRNWFKGLQNRRTGAHCCDEADCARTEARAVDGKWQAKAPNGSWIAVPPESVVVDQGNPTGEPILCGVPDEGSGWAVLCFVPGPDG